MFHTLAGERAKESRLDADRCDNPELRNNAPRPSRIPVFPQISTSTGLATLYVVSSGEISLVFHQRRNLLLLVEEYNVAHGMREMFSVAEDLMPPV